jgi:hypothetical protein
MDMLNVYKVTSENISGVVHSHGMCVCAFFTLYLRLFRRRSCSSTIDSINAWFENGLVDID